MDKQKRAEMFIAIKEKMEEIQEIVRDYDALDEFDAMFDAMQRVYEESEDSNDGPSNQIDFWLNQN